MCIVKELVRFLENGSKVLRDASSGKYQKESEDITRLRQELFDTNSNQSDRQKLKQDRNAIEKDVRKTWEKLKTSNG